MKANWNWLERSVFAVSCVLVAAVLGYVVVDAWTMGEAPPDLVVTVGKPLQGSGHWRVPITVENRGEETAEEVRVGVDLRQGGEVRERSELFLSYVPRHSRREGWVTFLHEPSPSGLEARPLGYARP
ncbi:hypothetical protein JRI60_24070 [Archangium violaceum]|uniref:hypothetical protein n=1 Tax=Archangium violaceum TaxID=83451 RepID=UPI0019512F54|nr:hypothetical protein [Archangium violaceum]QRO01873.1 hypothetical protein JRI60_24070 [Archangium violaceum]